MKKSHYILILLVFFSGYSYVHATVKGSSVLVSIEPFFTFPAAHSNNEMKGFGWFKNGFALEDNLTSCDFNSVYPVSGTVNLNGGTLNLLEDLIFKNVITLQGLGTIVGNSHLCEFCTTITHIPADAERFEDVHLALSNNIAIEGSATFADSVVFDGRGHTIEFDGSGEVVIDSNATLHMKNMIIKGIGGDNIRCVDDTAMLILDNVKWVQDTNFTFSLGSLIISDKVQFFGDAEFKHTSNKPITIKEKSIWELLASIDFVVGKRPSGGAVDPLVFTNASSVLKLSNCSLLVTDSGLQLAKGKIIFDEQVEIDMQSTDTTNGIVFGDGVDALNDVSIRLNAGVLIKHSGHTVYNNTDPTKLNALAKNATILREANSNIFMAQHITMPSMTFESVSNTVPPIQSADGKEITYQDNKIILPQVVLDITGKQNQVDTLCLHGSDEIFFAKGLLPLNLSVSGTGNLMHGNGGMSGIIELQDSDAELQSAILGSINQSPMLNGGTLTLGSDLTLGPDAMFTGSGHVDLTTCQLHLGAKDLTWTGTTHWHGNDGTIDLRAQVSLLGTWTIVGHVTINGNDNTLDLGTLGEIIIAPGATLRCKNVRLAGISESNIRCVDNSASLILEDVIWLQDGDYIFQKGSISFKDDVDFLGSYTFAYETNQTSTIQIKSEWHISDDMRFEIGKDPASSVWPLACIDNSSVLHLDNCDFVITRSGFQMIKGCVAYSRDVGIEIESTDLTNGVFLGNGVAEDDPIIQFNPGSNGRFEKGHLIWDVVDDTNLRSDSTTVRMVRSGESTFHIKQNLTLKKFTVDADALAVTIVDLGKTLSYDRCLFVLPNGQMEFTGDRYDAVTSLLGGNDLLFMQYGIMPMATFVLGTGNRIEGNGTITGPIVMLSPTAQLTSGLLGGLSADLILNGGTLTLSSNLMLEDNATFATAGTIDLDSYALEMGTKDSIWTSTLSWQSDVATIKLHAKTTLLGNWIFNGDCTIDGNGNVLDVGQLGQLIIAPGAKLTLRNLRITGIVDSCVQWLGENSVLKLDDVTWVQDGDFTIQQGSIYFEDVVDFIGPYIFTMDTACTSTIGMKSFWNISDSMQLSIGRTTTLGPEPLYFEDESSTLCLDNCIFDVTQHGIQFTQGRVVCSGDTMIDIHSTDTSNGIHLGNGTSAGDMIFEFNAGANVTFNSGHVVYDVTIPDSVLSRSTGAKLTRTASSTFQINQDVILQNLTIDASLYAATNVATGKLFEYNNCILILPNGSIIANAQRYNAFTNLLSDNDAIFLATGSYPMFTLISGSGNTILGNGSISGDITLLDSNAELTLSLDGLVLKDIALNGGTLHLGQDMNFSCKKQFAGTGTIDMSGNKLTLGPKDAIWTGTLLWEGQGSNIELNADLLLSGIWTFSDNCVIKGGGQKIDLGSSGEILIEDNSTLRLRDVIIDNVHGTNFRCLSDSSKILFEDSVLVLDDDYQFTTGSFEIDGDLTLSGSHIFAYQTKQTSTIASRGNLLLENMVTFSYDPPIANHDLMYLVDKTSKIHMNEATLHATTTGLHLVRGNLIAQNQCYLSSEATTSEEAIVFGDGISSSNDLDIDVLPESALQVVSGQVVIKNIDG